MFIDIFALDNCHLYSVEKNYVKAKNLILENSANMRRSNPYPSPSDIKRMQQYKERNPYEVLAELNDIYKEANTKQSVYCMISGITVYSPQKMIYKWEDVLDLIDVDFYGYKALIPRNTESILITTYGDYMQFPPLDERGNWHNSVWFDPDKPYDEYIKELKELLNKESMK